MHVCIQNDLLLYVALIPKFQAEHPYFIGTQFHPEYKSRPQRPAPVFEGLLKAVRSRNCNDNSNNVNNKLKLSSSPLSVQGKKSMQIVEETVDDEDDDDIDAALKKEVAEAIIAALEIGANNGDKHVEEAVTFSNNGFDLKDRVSNLNIPDHLKDKSLIGLRALEVDISKKENEKMGQYQFVVCIHVYTHIYIYT